LVPFPWPIEDLFVGDVDRNGCDDFGVVVPGGMLVAASLGASFTAVLLPHPGGGLGALGRAAVLRSERGAKTSIAAFAADGRGVALYASAGPAAFAAPVVVQAPPLPEYAAAPAPGPSLGAFAVDVDGDGDDDLLTELPDRAHWLRLVNADVDLRPLRVTFRDLGEVGETGYLKWELAFDLPREGVQRGLTDVELAVFLEDVSLPQPRYRYWGRLIGQVDPATAKARFITYAQVDPIKLLLMLGQNAVHPFPGGGISIGGGAVLSVHFKQPPNPMSGGAKRYQSMILHFFAGTGGHKSAVGALWSVRAEPPKPSNDDDLLPWS
jgi:hypothetical protein